ncbi:glycosyltransferase family 4 protein [Microbulbifer sediminum]|uniref:glycosyltransferase family 4 protein n=1 Tax=Microbulbifer sediminum TaxID=2904250 RepID=UPI001F193A03|nr:glycosyltransferase family 4 protein [Microbulbifer sediminum]
MIQNICHLIASREHGSIERHVADLSRWQAHNTGADVTVIAHPRYREALDRSVAFIALNTDRSRHHPNLAWRLANQLRAGKFQIAHGHGSKSAQLLAAVQPYTQLKHIITRHNVRHPRDKLASSFDARIAVSESAVANSRLSWHVIPNGIELPLRGDLASGSLLQPVTDLVLPCRLTKLNRVDQLLQAMQGLPGISLSVTGSGPEEDSLRKTCDYLAISDRVTFAGHQATGAQPPRAPAITVIPSHGEESSYLLVDALLRRQPVLCRRVGVAEEYLPSRFLLETDDAEHLSGRVRTALRERDTLVEAFAPAFSRAARHLTLDAMASATWDVYRGLLDRDQAVAD